MLSCLVSYTHYNEWLQHLCVTNTKINTEIKWQAEPEDIELHLMPVYLLSFCVSIFYPFYRDTLIFIVHRCHHCLMYTACKQSKRMHESQREFFFKRQIYAEMGSSWLECEALTLVHRDRSVKKKKTEVNSEEWWCRLKGSKSNHICNHNVVKCRFNKDKTRSLIFRGDHMREANGSKKWVWRESLHSCGEPLIGSITASLSEQQ